VQFPWSIPHNQGAIFEGATIEQPFDPEEAQRQFEAALRGARVASRIVVRAGAAWVINSVSSARQRTPLEVCELRNKLRIVEEPRSARRKQRQDVRIDRSASPYPPAPTARSKPPCRRAASFTRLNATAAANTSSG
jgi:hypothetical protein